MIRTWTVDPSPEWLRANQQWLPEANLPGTRLCEATFEGIRCELVEQHETSHMVHMKKDVVTS